MVKNGGTRDFLCLSLLISFKGDTSCRTCIVFQARAIRGTRAECANFLAHSICKFEGTDRKHEMRHEHSELREKSQIALQFTAENVARGMDG